MNARVALVHDWLTGMRGGEKVLERIATEFPGAPIHTLFHFPGTVSAALEAHPIRTSFLQRAPAIERRYRHYLPLFPAAIEEFDLAGFDLVISTSHCVAKGVIPAPGAYHLCYCHTPMRYAWDQEHAYFPRRTGAVARLRALVLSWLRVWDAATAPRVDRFVANSSFVAQRIHRYYGRDADVLPPPVAIDRFTPPGEPPRRDYALVVSALAPYKRVEVAIAACARLGLPLRIVGTGPERERLAGLAGDQVAFLGRIAEEELRELYRHALCLVQPQVEDFAIAPVEALACATPGVARGEGGVLDIVTDGEHGLLYLPATGDEAGALAAAIDKVRDFEFNRERLRGRAEIFSEERFAAGFRALLTRPMAARTPGARASHA